jgi:hypothetical protein
MIIELNTGWLGFYVLLYVYGSCLFFSIPLSMSSFAFPVGL